MFCKLVAFIFILFVWGNTNDIRAQYFSVSKIDFDKTKIKNLKKEKILKQYNLANILRNDNNDDDYKLEIRLQKKIQTEMVVLNFMPIVFYNLRSYLNYLNNDEQYTHHMINRIIF